MSEELGELESRGWRNRGSRPAWLALSWRLVASSISNVRHAHGKPLVSMQELMGYPTTEEGNFTPHRDRRHNATSAMQALRRAASIFRPLSAAPICLTTLYRTTKAQPETTTKQSPAPAATMALPPKFAAHRMAFGQPVSQNDAVPPTAHSIEIYLDYCVRVSKRQAD